MQQIPLATDAHYIERRIYSKSLIKVKPNSKYKIVGGLYGWFLFFDKNGNAIGTREGSLDGVITNEFTTDSNTYYVGLVLHKENNGVTITPSDIPSDLTLQEVTDEIVLRSIGDVKDTLNLTTGEYVQRIGEVVLDGSEQWNENTMVVNGDYVQNNTEFLNHLRLRHGGIASPNILVVDSEEWTSPTRQSIYSGSNLGLTLLSSNLTTLDKAGWCAYLSQNPITIQYVLATPIIHKVNLTNTTKLPSYTSTTH